VENFAVSPLHRHRGIVCAVDASVVAVTRSAFVVSRKSSTASRGRVGVDYIGETAGGGRCGVGVRGADRRAQVVDG
jgi:hypothetical protein